MAIAPPGPMTATSTPATAGPTIQPKLSLMPIRAFACCNCDGGTICGRMAPAAGRKNASAAPWKAASTASCQICAVPVSSSTAAVICTAARTRSLVIMRAARGSLSAHTPPTSASRTSGYALGSEHQSEVGARPGEVEHGEGQRHGRDAVAEHRDALREEHVAEVAPAQRAGALAQPCGDEAGEAHARSLQGRRPERRAAVSGEAGGPGGAAAQPPRPAYDILVAPRAAQSAMTPVSVAKPNVTANPTRSDVEFQPVFKSERMASKT